MLLSILLALWLVVCITLNVGAFGTTCGMVAIFVALYALASSIPDAQRSK
jgi:hypothetical protein